MHISDIGKLLGSDDLETQRQAAERLSQNAEAAVEVAVVVVEHSGDSDRVVAEYCVATLEDLGPPAASSLESLAQLTQSNNSDVAYWAATLLGRAGVTAAEQAGALGQLLGSEAAETVRERAAWALGRIGRAAEAARPHLESATKATSKRIALAATKALDALG